MSQHWTKYLHIPTFNLFTILFVQIFRYFFFKPLQKQVSYFSYIVLFHSKCTCSVFQYFTVVMIFFILESSLLFVLLFVMWGDIDFLPISLRSKQFLIACTFHFMSSTYVPSQNTLAEKVLFRNMKNMEAFGLKKK